MDRFFIAAPLERAAPGATVELEGAEAHHLARVKRIGPGTTVRLFDGSGGEVLAEVEAVLRGGAAVRLRVVEGLAPRAGSGEGAALRVAVTLGVAPPKGKRMSFALEKGTELGMAALFPLATRRGVVSIAGKEAVKLDRWRQATIEAAKQCGLARLPEILPPRTVAEAVAAARATDLRLIAHLAPDARPLRDVLAAWGPEPPARATVLIGPEGGFVAEEVAIARGAGFAVVRLAPTVLRVETAAIATLAALAVAYP